MDGSGVGDTVGVTDVPTVGVIVTTTTSVVINSDPPGVANESQAVSRTKQTKSRNVLLPDLDCID